MRSIASQCLQLQVLILNSGATDVGIPASSHATGHCGPPPSDKPTLPASLSGTFLQIGNQLVTPLKAWALFTSAQLPSTDAVSALRKLWVLSGTFLQIGNQLVTPLKAWALFTSAQLPSTDAVSALRKLWVLITLRASLSGTFLHVPTE